MKTYTVILHSPYTYVTYTGSAIQLMGKYYSNTDSMLYDIVGLFANLNKRELFEELNNLTTK